MEDSISAVMDYLYERSPRNLPPGALAEVFDRLVWCLDDNGAGLGRHREAWLQGGDKRRVAIALAMDEFFPFRDQRRMEEVLIAISGRWPEFSARCTDLTEMRRKLTE